MPGTAEIIAAQLADRRLNSRDKAIQRHLGTVEGDLPADELSPGNIAALLRQLQNARHPLERATLQAELDRLRSLAENMQPMPAQSDSRNGPMTLPYTSADQRPTLSGGNPMPPQPFMDGAPTGVRRINAVPMPNPATWPMPNMPQAPRG